MIFIGLFLFIAIVVIGLNMHDNSNLKTIEEYLQKNDCKEYIYSRGSYKALCNDKLIEIQNSFTIDLEKNSKYFNYKDINSIDIEKLKIIVNDKDSLEFKQKEEIEKFYNELTQRLNK